MKPKQYNLGLRKTFSYRRKFEFNLLSDSNIPDDDVSFEMTTGTNQASGIENIIETFDTKYRRNKENDV